jgi:hypothetical protein
MPRRTDNQHRPDIARQIKQGFGQGQGAQYKPWKLVQNTSTQGLATQEKGWKTDRPHHFLNILHFKFFLVCEWSLRVTDIREYYPLSIEDTVHIAKECGITHPVHTDTKLHQIMTSDFLITKQQSIGTVDCVRGVRYAKTLHSKRKLAELEIERRYWESRDIDWGIVTERDIPMVLVENVKKLYKHRTLNDRLNCSPKEVHIIACMLTQEVQQGQTLQNAGTVCDRSLGFDLGTGLTVALHLLATRQWCMDMNVPFHPGKPLTLLSVSQELVNPI